VKIADNATWEWMKGMRNVSNPKPMSHKDHNTQQATEVVKENHDKVPAGSNQTLGITYMQHSDAFHKFKFLTFQRLQLSFTEK
jgi:hypothetical protein